MANPEKYPGTNVYKNIPDIANGKKWAQFESMLTTRRYFQLIRFFQQFQNDPEALLEHTGIHSNYDLNHLCLIHKYLFQDAYEWAGQIRSYDMKLGEDIFTPAVDIDRFFSTVVHQEIKECRQLDCQDRATLVKRLARYLGLINQIHSFPEGNGRTQRVFISQLAFENGYSLEWEKVQPWENQTTAQNVHRGQDYTGVEAMIDKILIRVNA